MSACIFVRTQTYRKKTFEDVVGLNPPTTLLRVRLLYRIPATSLNSRQDLNFKTQKVLKLFWKMANLSSASETSDGSGLKDVGNCVLCYDICGQIVDQGN